MLYSRCYGFPCLCYITCYIAVPSPILCLNVHLAGSPRDASAQTPAVSYREDCNYQWEPAGDGGRKAENPLAALQHLLAGIPDSNTEELEALLHDLPTQDDANQAAVMTIGEAVEVSYML